MAGRFYTNTLITAVEDFREHRSYPIPLKQNSCSSNGLIVAIYNSSVKATFVIPQNANNRHEGDAGNENEFTLSHLGNDVFELFDD